MPPFILWVVSLDDDDGTAAYFQDKQTAQAYVGTLRTSATTITIRQAQLEEKEPPAG